MRVQRIISLIAIAYRTIPHEALCILTGITPIHIKAQEVATQYNITGRSTQKYQIDKAENPRNWLHPAESASTTQKTKERSTGGISSRMVARANKEWYQGLPYLQGRCSRNNLNSSETTGVQIIRLNNWLL